MGTENDATEDGDAGQAAAARLFVMNLSSDTTLRTAWSELLSEITQALQALTAGPAHDKMLAQSVEACDNFLVQNGYDTTGAAVLGLLQTPFWAEHLKADQPNADSDRFVQALLVNVDVFNAWNALLLAVNSGAQPTGAIDDYLAENGYDCTSIQVAASFVKMRNHALSYWSGTYNTSITATEQTVTTLGALPPNDKPTTITLNGPAQQGPTLVIVGTDTVSLVGAEFVHDLVRSATASSVDKLNPEIYSQYVYANGELAWNAGFNAEDPTVYSGRITFSEVAQPTGSSSAAPNQFYTPAPANSYTGPLFNGTLTTKVKGNFDPIHGTKTTVTTYTIAGELVPDLSKANNADNIPGGKAHEDLLETLAKWFGYISIGLMIVKYVWSMGKKFKTTKEFQGESKAFDSLIDDAGSKGESLRNALSDTRASPVQELNFAESDVVAGLKARLQNARSEGEMAEIQAEIDARVRADDDFDALPEGEASEEGSGWARDLGTIARDLPK